MGMRGGLTTEMHMTNADDTLELRYDKHNTIVR